MLVLGLVTARGGSKGVPRKNIRNLHGKPLLAYTAEAALAAKRLSKVILSTEDDEIAEIGRGLGLDVPFTRPAELSRDDTPTFPVVKHALLKMVEAGNKFDAVCLLQPTNPLRRPEDIDACIGLLACSQADCVVSVLQVPTEYNPNWVYWSNEAGHLRLSTGNFEPIARRQDLPPAFHRDGSVYVTRTEVILDQNSLYGNCVIGYEMLPKFSVNIDTEEDWIAAERCLQRNAQKPE